MLIQIASLALHIIFFLAWLRHWNPRWPSLSFSQNVTPLKSTFLGLDQVTISSIYVILFVAVIFKGNSILSKTGIYFLGFFWLFFRLAFDFIRLFLGRCFGRFSLRLSFSHFNIILNLLRPFLWNLSIRINLLLFKFMKLWQIFKSSKNVKTIFEKLYYK